MASRTATYIAFGSIAKRTLTTCTPTRALPWPKPVRFLPPYQTFQIASTAHAQARRLPRNHFTSNSQPIDDAAARDRPAKLKERREPRGKRRDNPSLRRVAVEAQRSRGAPIKGRGRRRYVDPDAETKDVTAYCAAEQYNLHVARDLLKKEGYQPDPYRTELFPQVLHVQTPPSWFRGRKEDEATSDALEEQKGDIFVFTSGCVVFWNVSERLGLHLVDSVLRKATDSGHPGKQEVEDMEYLEDPTREHSQIVGDTIILGTKPSSDHPSPDTPPDSSTAAAASAEDLRSPELDTTLVKIAFSSAIARSTKLDVLENTLNNYIAVTRNIPRELAAGVKPRITRRLVLRLTGELLALRADLNLYSELTDSLPDIFWDSPHSLGLERLYDQVSSVLDVDIRIKSLNDKMDYASEIATVLREQLDQEHGHRLEWIIIWLIVIEVLFGIYHICKELLDESHEGADPLSEANLAKAWYLRELAGRDLERHEAAGRKS